MHWNCWPGYCAFRALPLAGVPPSRPPVAGSARADLSVLPGDRLSYVIRPLEFRHPAGIRLALSHVCSFVLVLPGDRLSYVIRPLEFRHPAGIRLALSHVCSFVLVLPGPAVVDV